MPRHLTVARGPIRQDVCNAIIDLLRKKHACFQAEIERRLPYHWSEVKDAREDIAIIALTKAGFTVFSRETLFYNGVWLDRKVDGDLDVIAQKGTKTYGIEVKNRKSSLSEVEYGNHLARCKKVGLHPAFIVTGATRGAMAAAKKDGVPLVITARQFVENTL